MITWLYVKLWSLKEHVKDSIRPVMKISLDGVLWSLIISMVTTLLAGAVIGLFVERKPEDLGSLKQFLDINPLLVLLAGLEDFVFVLPIFLFRGRMVLPVMVISGILFTLGHSYQGDAAMLPKLVTVPVVYLLARKYGILSTALAHGINDVIAVYLIQRYYKP